MEDRNRIVKELGVMLDHAVRASITKGAIYEPGEHISNDAEGEWHSVADTLVNLIEVMIKHGEVLKGEIADAETT